MLRPSQGSRNTYYTYTPFILLFLIFISLSTLASGEKRKKSLTEKPVRVHFDLPGQELAFGLVEFALQSNMTILATSELVANMVSSPVIGSFTVEQSLSLLLANTPLRFDRLKNTNTFIIKPKAPDDDKKTNDTFVTEHIDTVEEVSVHGIQFPFRYQTVTSSQVHANLSTFDTARFIHVLPQQIISDQWPDDLNDILRNTSSITPGDGIADTNDDFFIRGFPRNASYIDGFRMEENTGIKLLPANIERIEILKGPSTLHYGQAEPGGIVNIVRKKPRQHAHKKIMLAAGDEQRQQFNIDLTGKIFPRSDNLYYRLVYANNQQETIRNLRDIEREFIASSLTWNISNNTSVNMSYDYQKSSHIRDQGTIILTPDSDDINIIALDQAPRQKQAGFDAKFTLANINLTHHFNDIWHASASYFNQHEERFGVRGSRNTLLTNNTLIDSQDLAPDTVGVFFDGIFIPITIGTDINSPEDQLYSVATIRSLYDESAETKSQFLRFVLQGSPQTHGFSHHIAFGLEAYTQQVRENYTLEERRDIRSISLNNSNTLNALDTVEAVFENNPDLGTLTERSQELDYSDYGIYLQNNIELSPSWLSSLGARYTITKAERTDINTGVVTELETFEELSGDLGLVYKPMEPLSLYLNYSETMKANYQIDDIGSNITEPELSNQIEFGIKFLALNNRFISTVAAYDINKKNIVNINFVEGLREASINAKQKSTGVDWDFSYQVNSRLDVIGAASFIDPNVTSGENTGNVPTLASKKNGSLFLNYRFSRKNKQHININLGAYYAGKRFGDNENTVVLDDYSTIDIGTSYLLPIQNTKWRLQFNIKNVFDERYVSAIEGAIRTNQGLGRSFTAILELEI